MSDFSVIEAISGELRRQIFEVLQATPGADFGIGGSLEKISVLSPGAKLPDGTLASLYLYHIEIDGHLRNQRMLADRMADDLYRMPPLPLKPVAVIVPLTSSAVAGSFLLMPTPLLARMRNWLLVVVSKLLIRTSPQTNEPG